jgi:hypothetical protein
MMVLKVACGAPHSSDGILPNPARETIAPLKRAKSSLSVAENIFQWQPRARSIALKIGRGFRKCATIIGQPMRPIEVGMPSAAVEHSRSTKATPGDVGMRERASRRVDDLAILAQIFAGAVD